MSVHGSNNVGRAVQTDPTLLRYASAITERKKCWELLAEKLTGFKLCASTRHNIQQHATGCGNTTTCVVWSWRLIDCFALTSAVRRGFSPFSNPKAMPSWRAPIRVTQLSVAATACVIWLCTCVRYPHCRGLVYVCPVCTVFNAVESSSICCSLLLYFMTFLNKFNSARIGNTFACWHFYYEPGCAINEN